MIVTESFSNIKGLKVFTTTFLPEGAVQAIIQINHGLAEHSGRYHDFARFLCDKGYGVYLHDHPGHGKTATNQEETGYIPWKNGWDLMADVTHSINKTIRKKHPQIPVFLFGHSMGSVLARHYNATYPMYFKGMILSGTTNPSQILLKLSFLMVRILYIFQNDTSKSPFFNKIFYAGLSRGIKKTYSIFDWLSTDSVEVKKYMDDPMCGFQLSLGFFKSLFRGTLQTMKTENNLRFRKNFATLIISGKYDSAGDFGRDPMELMTKYKNQGYFNTHLRLLEGRHELLNETKPIRDEAYKTIADWIGNKLSGNF